MDILRRKQLQHLFEHPLDEFERRLLADAENPVVDVPRLAHFVLLARTAQPRIGGQRPDGMPRKFDFGNHRDETLRSVIHHVADLILRIVTAVRRFVEFAVLVVRAARIAADQRTAAYGTYFGEFRIFPDFDAPPLIVGQMPVEDVEFVQGHDVERLLHLIDREEVTADIEHHAPVTQTRFVLDRDDGQFDGPHVVGFVRCRRKQLAQRLHGIERPLRSSGDDVDPAGSYEKAVGLRRHRLVAGDVHRMVRGLVGMPYPRAAAEQRHQHLVQRGSHAGQTLVVEQQDHLGVGGQAEGALPLHDMLRERHDSHFAVGRNHPAATATAAQYGEQCQNR